MKYLLFVLFFTFTISMPAAEERDCAVYKFDKAHPRLMLKSTSAVWRIENMGPVDVIIMAKQDKSFQQVIPQHKGGSGLVFLGDTAFTYILYLSANGQAAKVRVCPPSR